jgi:hypothetical protein
MPDTIAARITDHVHQPDPADFHVLHANLLEDLVASQRASRGRKILCHAIEHLTEGLADSRESASERSARLQAVQILMALNREIYFESNAEPGFCERCMTWLRAHAI